MLSGNAARPEKMPHEYFSGVSAEIRAVRGLAPIRVYSCWTNKKSLEEKSPGLCDPNRIQTYNLLIRSQMLYSIELWDQFRSNDLYFDSAYFVAPSSLRITIFFSLILAFFPESALR